MIVIVAHLETFIAGPDSSSEIVVRRSGVVEGEVELIHWLVGEVQDSGLLSVGVHVDDPPWPEGAGLGPLWFSYR